VDPKGSLPCSQEPRNKLCCFIALTRSICRTAPIRLPAAVCSAYSQLSRISGSYAVVRFSFGICFLTLPTWRASHELLTTWNEQLSLANTVKYNEWFSFHGFSCCIRDLNTSGRFLPSHVQSQTYVWFHGPMLLAAQDRVGHAKVTYCVLHGCNLSNKKCTFYPATVRMCIVSSLITVWYIPVTLALLAIPPEERTKCKYYVPSFVIYIQQAVISLILFDLLINVL
jgi:hypothetical protein